MKSTLDVKLQGSTQSLIKEETVSQKSQMLSFRSEKKPYLAQGLWFKYC